MCGLCSEDLEEVEKERQRMHHAAADMRGFAARLDSMARGRILPHSEDAKRIWVQARNIIRNLVQEWL